MVIMNIQNNDWLDKLDKEIGEEQRDYEGPHCCLTMDCELLSAGTVLKYNSEYREYGIKIPESTGCALMNYCIACGTKLPLSLRDQWFDILKQEYCFEDPNDKDRDRIPKEFLTDEWWKNRGL